MIDIVACVPSRGLIFTESIESVESNLEQSGLKTRAPILEWTMPIPDSFNTVVDRALALDPTFVWLVEEDIVVPPGGLSQLLAVRVREGAAVAAAKYKQKNGEWCHQHNNAGELIFAGFGCVLIHVLVFKHLERPWFRSDVAYGYDRTGNLAEKYLSDEECYGRHDIRFYAELKRTGQRFILCEDVICKHLRLRAFGKPKSNKGCHEIEVV